MRKLFIIISKEGSLTTGIESKHKIFKVSMNHITSHKPDNSSFNQNTMETDGKTLIILEQIRGEEKVAFALRNICSSPTCIRTSLDTI